MPQIILKDWVRLSIIKEIILLKMNVTQLTLFFHESARLKNESYSAKKEGDF
jgi:hypothetical protein